MLPKIGYELMKRLSSFVNQTLLICYTNKVFLVKTHLGENIQVRNEDTFFGYYLIHYLLHQMSNAYFIKNRAWLYLPNKN